MKILIGCEESQVLTKLFRSKGHEAFSCDLKPCTGGHKEWHLRGDIFDFLMFDWDIFIGHPPCTYLTVTANKWLKDQKSRKSGKLVGEKRRDAVEDAKDFFLRLWNYPIPKICLENPVGVINSIIPPTQILQPFFFGDADKKRTCLWLKNLPNLIHAKENGLFQSKTHVTPKEQTFTAKFAGNSINAAAFRSKTFNGIANAMVEQWG